MNAQQNKHGLFRFRWSHKGRTRTGIIMEFGGSVFAVNAGKACEIVDTMLRERWPELRWMQGKEIEANGVTLGPTVQKLKRIK